MSFDTWDDNIHEQPEQKKRFDSSLSAKLVPLSIDFENRIGRFNGSGKFPYETTLTSCTCSDFVRRKLPCKHMYRLAIELNIIDVSNITIEKRSYGNDERTLKDNAKRFIDTLDEESALSFARYCYDLYNNDVCILEYGKMSELLIKSEVFEECIDDNKKLSKLKKADLIEFIPLSNGNLSKLKKTDLITLVMGNPTVAAKNYLNSLVVISAKKEYKSILLSLHKYAHKLYPQEPIQWF